MGRAPFPQNTASSEGIWTPSDGALGPHNSASQMASRSVQPTDREMSTHTTERATCVAVGCMYVMRPRLGEYCYRVIDGKPMVTTGEK